MLVSIIIINYNTFKITVDCIHSIIKYTSGVDYEVILVDNASPHENPDEFLKIFPNIKLIKAEQNGGFAKGNNLGIKEAKGDIILLLNSDTFLSEDSISKAANYLASHKDIGVLAIKLVYPNGKIQHSARKFRYLGNEILDLLRPLLFLLPYKKRARIMLNQYYNCDFNIYCDWVSGAFFMFPQYVLKCFPGNKLDERYFMYGEDQLWCYQIQLCGYKVFYLAETELVHIEGYSTSQKPYKFYDTIVKRELDIMRFRKGTGLYYQAFKLLFTSKKYVSYWIKKWLHS